MQADTQKWRPYIPLSELTSSELERIIEAVDRVLEDNYPEDERIDWFGAWNLGQRAKEELAKR